MPPLPRYKKLEFLSQVLELSSLGLATILERDEPIIKAYFKDGRLPAAAGTNFQHHVDGLLSVMGYCMKLAKIQSSLVDEESTWQEIMKEFWYDETDDFTASVVNRPPWWRDGDGLDDYLREKGILGIHAASEWLG